MDLMNLRKRTDKIRKTLKTLYPQVKPRLLYHNPFELLIATMLSAQCTDAQVNNVTRHLFEAFKSPADIAATPAKKIEQLIHSVGLYRNKAKNIKACAQVIVASHGGEVPKALEDLVKLPGVGRKTANVVRGAAFGRPGLVVDTHVARISQRLGLTECRDPVKIELDLMRLVPKKDWSDFSLRLIFFGRETCKARKPACADCPLDALCPYPHKTKK
jgi:endonuclease-3